MIGQQIDRYRVVAKIGEGGMGAVFEAVDEQIGKHVAIKVLHKDNAKNLQISQRFINEAKAINHVDHPGVVQVSAFGSLPDGTAYIVMELLKGETLNARMKAQGGRMPMLNALSLARQLASALAAAHGKGIIHRDLKPDNVMLVPDSAFPGGERTKLLDFGIAKVKAELQGSGDQVMTRAGVMMGTPLYMSPEQCRNASDVDEKADVYSLGVMLYRMLAGKPPFSAQGTGELMAMHIYMQPPSLAEHDRSLPEPLVQLVHRMLAKKREERPSMSQVAQELEKIINQAAAAPAGPPQPTPQPAHPVALVNEGATVLSESNKLPPGPPAAVASKSRAPIFAGIAAVLLAAAGGGFYVFQLGAKPTAPQPTTPSKPETMGAKPTDPGAGQPAPVADKQAAKPQTVDWVIESEPTGADVYQVDTGELLGNTPYRSSQPAKPGQITLELRLKGYLPAKLTVDGDKDAKPPAVKLEPDKAKKRDKKPKDKPFKISADDTL